MQSDDSGTLAFIEVAMDRIAHLGAQFFVRVRFGVNGMTESTGDESTFGRIFDEEYDFCPGAFHARHLTPKAAKRRNQVAGTLPLGAQSVIVMV